MLKKSFNLDHWFVKTAINFYVLFLICTAHSLFCLYSNDAATVTLVTPDVNHIFEVKEEASDAVIRQFRVQIKGT